MTDEFQRERIDRILEAVGRAAKGDYTARIELPGEKDALDRIADGINRLLEAVGQQIDEKQNVEAALKDSIEKYHRLEANIPGVVYLFKMHPDGTHSAPYVSGAVKELFDLSPKDLQSDTIFFIRLLHPDDADRFDASVRRSAETLTPWREVLRLIVNGEVRWYECMSRPELQLNGDIIWNGITIEITERMKAFENLRKREKRLSDILSLSPIGIAIYEASGKCVTVNSALADLMAIPEQRLLDHSCYEINAYEKAGLSDQIRTVIRTQNASRFEFNTPAGAVAESHLIPYFNKGVLVMVQDISERKQSEDPVQSIPA